MGVNFFIRKKTIHLDLDHIDFMHSLGSSYILPKFKQLCQTVQYDPTLELKEMEEKKRQVLTKDIERK